ncbi:MAG: crossover junction endodeoxyribonuclease RuvC [Planctomycetes bacterium]|jgi:crossover junction endodeoxyribonuclease RuvC|nr:crossover junction endodeoxyribonuclease RuvC [Planctomycetota bacterium]MBT4029497.1 crossover junction endodeoxyribonuclease RuvC [Planctomycetota bacterium]MBT4560633.1 crossover junction endodeoxyribonuclease RuvC [Planctomycetota bacterium]MBT5101073.1 crossover junction endodeoxyribonuclease RuvC [Planctomycetota bacterium]MBT7317697.1 crossover junction endodeoxyribonuclease RuvC [Planctomycetota bacterium]
MSVARILGVDPGTRKAGWAVLDVFKGGQLSLVASGTWRLGDSRVAVGQRLYKLQVEMAAVMGEFQPTQVALESAFFGQNAKTALRIGEARGLVLAAAAGRDLPLQELPPALVKRRVAGAGAASKEQIAAYVRVHLQLPSDHAFDSEDASDACAVALCMAFSLDANGISPAQNAKKGCKLPPGARFQ